MSSRAPERREPIGTVEHQARRGTVARCNNCHWTLAKRDPEDAISLLRSHNRIAHDSRIPVYMED